MIASLMLFIESKRPCHFGQGCICNNKVIFQSQFEIAVCLPMFKNHNMLMKVQNFNVNSSGVFVAIISHLEFDLVLTFQEGL